MTPMQEDHIRLLVLGGNGQVARSLARLGLRGVSVTAMGRARLDIRERGQIAAAIAECRPDILVNAAAYTAVDKAESEPELAFAVNEAGAGHAAAAAAAAGLPIIHLSTDYVFAGDAHEPYRETDAALPQGVYARSKLAGEVAVARANPAHVILRTAWVHAPFGHNFLKTMLRLARNQASVRVVADQYGHPTAAADLAEGIVHVARLLHATHSPALFGLFHMVSPNWTSWAGFAAEIFRQSVARGGPGAVVEPIATAEYPTAARRPARSCLDTEKLRTVYHLSLPDWQQGVSRSLEAILAGADDDAA